MDSNPGSNQKNGAMGNMMFDLEDDDGGRHH